MGKKIFQVIFDIIKWIDCYSIQTDFAVIITNGNLKKQCVGRMVDGAQHSNKNAITFSTSSKMHEVLHCRAARQLNFFLYILASFALLPALVY